MAAEEPDERADEGDRHRWTLGETSRRSVPDMVADRVLELVRSGELTPGSQLPTEPDLARRFGAARSSVRSGLQRLQAQGVVEVKRGRGWFVSSAPTRPAGGVMREQLAAREFDVRDVMEVRIALEGASSALAATRATPGQRDDIQKLALAHQAADHDDGAVLLATDEEFHSAIVEASGNEYLQTVYSMVTPLLAEVRKRSFTGAHMHDRSALDHLQIAAQIRRRDEFGARMAATGHLLGLYKSVSRTQGPDEGRAELSTFVDVADEPLFGEG